MSVLEVSKAVGQSNTQIIADTIFCKNNLFCKINLSFVYGDYRFVSHILKHRVHRDLNFHANHYNTLSYHKDSKQKKISLIFYSQYPQPKIPAIVQ